MTGIEPQVHHRSFLPSQSKQTVAAMHVNSNERTQRARPGEKHPKSGIHMLVRHANVQTCESSLRPLLFSFVDHSFRVLAFAPLRGTACLLSLDSIGPTTQGLPRKTYSRAMTTTLRDLTSGTRTRLLTRLVQHPRRDTAVRITRAGFPRREAITLHDWARRRILSVSVGMKSVAILSTNLDWYGRVYWLVDCSLA